MEILERDEYGWISVKYDGYIVNSEDAEPHDMLSLLIALEIVYIINPPAMFVIANDLFAWGCADGEDVSWAELPDLFRRVLADPGWGATYWCCVHRNQRPQLVIEKSMKEKGIWTDEMESLPRNHYWSKYLENHPHSYGEMRDWLRKYDKKHGLTCHADLTPSNQNETPLKHA